MKTLVRTCLLVMLALAVCSAAAAQVTQPVQVVRADARFQPATRAATPLLTDTTGGFPVPGLGFDYVHHAAVNRDLGVRALIDPSTQQQLALARQIRRETPVGAGIVLPFSNVPQIIVVALPPPVIIIQQQAPPAPERPEPVHMAVRDEPAPPPTPPRELAELVLVRLDGKLVFAVAFSIRDAELVYITPEGIRRSLLLSDLDLEFTRRLNEERGTSLRLPS
jgi:hypothetical protein